jgi:diguanylate cyclase
VFRVLGCFVDAHDYRLAVLAGWLGLVAAITAFRLYRRAYANYGIARLGWLFLTSVATGTGIWSTHFVAMLAFDPGLPTAYELGFTIASLFIAILFTGLGFAIALKPLVAAQLAGGGIIGLGIAAMHFTGMAAFQTEGHLSWDADLVVASIVIGTALAAIATMVAGSCQTVRDQLGGAAILTLAICGLHFTAMGAVTITPDPQLQISAAGLSSGLLALSITSATLLVMGTGLASALVEQRTVKAGYRRLRQMADATVEGLVIVDGNRIVDVNRAFVKLTGLGREEHIGTPFLGSRLCLPDTVRLSNDSSTVEGQLLAESEDIPVEVIRRRIHFEDRWSDVFALRDLRAWRHAEQRIRYLADHDILTGLPNRTSFHDQLARTLDDAEQARSQFALFRMDLDRFKEVNDVFGHPVGDEVLRQVASRLRNLVDDCTTVSRQGGDEFFLLQRRTDQPQDAAVLSRAVLDCFSAPFRVADRDVWIGSSLGIVIYPDDGVTAEALLSNADMALMRAKAEGRGTACFFEAATDEEIRDRRVLAFDLGRAIRDGGLSVHYQPQIRVADGEIVGFEALVRWHHPERGHIAPSHFIQIAEECGLIGPLGEWVLQAVCNEAVNWPHSLPVAVNLSPLQLQQANLPEAVHAILVQSGLSPGRLELEVTETALFQDMQRSLDVLRRLKTLGLRIAMDDFGTGYSSLSTFQAFPFDKIKIDRSFIDDVQNRHQAAAIVRAILALARNLSIPVIAEGVETEEQLAFLVTERCDIAQGYLFGRPGPIEVYQHFTHAIVSDGPDRDIATG